MTLLSHLRSSHIFLSARTPRWPISKHRSGTPSGRQSAAIERASTKAGAASRCWNSTWRSRMCVWRIALSGILTMRPTILRTSPTYSSSNGDNMQRVEIELWVYGQDCPSNSGTTGVLSQELPAQREDWNREPSRRQRSQWEWLGNKHDVAEEINPELDISFRERQQPAARATGDFQWLPAQEGPRVGAQDVNAGPWISEKVPETVGETEQVCKEDQMSKNISISACTYQVVDYWFRGLINTNPRVSIGWIGCDRTTKNLL